MAASEPEPNEALLTAGEFALHPLPPARAHAIPRTSLIGREREIATVAALITDGGERLVTLTGPGGVGKTRLAFAAQQALTAAFAGDVWFVPLAQVRGPELVLTSIAQVLDVWESGRQPLLDQLIAVLRPRHCLLVLDNFEQVIDAATLVSELLIACPALHVIVTSRELLHIAGEHVVVVPPLPASTHAAGAAPSVQLFIERARAVRHDFAPDQEAMDAVTAICARLDGLPLAIELAAARTVILTPRQLLTRLSHRLPMLTGGARDSPARLRTMRSAIAWSCDLLLPAEQALFRRLAVFAGGFTLSAAEHVAAALATADDSVLDTVTSLADKSLLRQELGPNGSLRFRMLETIREYALELLDASGETDAAQHAHAAWCTQLAQQVDAVFWCRAPGDWRALAEPDLDNLRQALTWALTHGETTLSLTMATALSPVWLYGGRASEGADWLHQALAADEADDTCRARAMEVAGLLAIRHGSYALATSYAAEGATLATRAGDPGAAARIAYLAGCIASVTSDEAAAAAHLDDARRRFEALGDLGRLAGVYCELAVLGTGTNGGEPDPAALVRAEAQCQRGLELYREIGLGVGIARAQHGLGYIAYKSGRYRDALRAVQEALEERAALREISGINANLEDIADIAAHTGQPAIATRLYGAAEALRAFYGTPLGLRYRAEYEAEVAVARQGLPAEVFAREWAAGRALTLDQAIAQALAVSLAPATRTTNADGHFGLSPRELDVLRLLAEGHSDREIAGALFISPRTVNHHVAGILAKLDVDNRTQATSRAVREHLIGADVSGAAQAG